MVASALQQRRSRTRNEIESLLGEAARHRLPVAWPGDDEGRLTAAQALAEELRDRAVEELAHGIESGDVLAGRGRREDVGEL